MKKMRVLVVDDSAYNRRTLSEILSAIRGVEVVGKAADGHEALRLVDSLKPDLVTLDLEMPKMDGFSFLRLQMARAPVPVIIVSGYSAKENVFRALELGALDFVAKPAREANIDLNSVREELTQKVDLVRHLSATSLGPRRRAAIIGGGSSGNAPPSTSKRSPQAEAASQVRCVVAVGASTGGPSALLELLARFPVHAAASVVIAQHMPERFTRTFAERLDRLGDLKVTEASDAHRLLPGQAWLCPGGRCMEVAKAGDGWLVKVKAPEPADRYIPSVDRLFASVAHACKEKALGVVLTGMGDDGAEGVRKIHEAGGQVLAEARETAVIYGMPSAAVRTGVVSESLPIHELSDRIAQLLARGH